MSGSIPDIHALTSPPALPFEIGQSQPFYSHSDDEYASTKLEEWLTDIETAGDLTNES